mgnify:CR=1 FL=1
MCNYEDKQYFNIKKIIFYQFWEEDKQTRVFNVSYILIYKYIYFNFTLLYIENSRNENNKKIF